MQHVQIRPAIPASYTPKINEKIGSHKNLYANSCIRRGQNPETTQVPIHKKTDKQTMVYPDGRALMSPRKKHAFDVCNTDESPRSITEVKEVRLKGQHSLEKAELPGPKTDHWLPGLGIREEADDRQP